MIITNLKENQIVCHSGKQLFSRDEIKPHQEGRTAEKVMEWNL